MSVNYHVFSSIHTSLLLGNPPIWSCEETGRLLAVTTHPFLAGAVLAVVVAIAKEIF